MAVLDVRDVHKTYERDLRDADVVAVRGVTLKLAAGEIVAVVGSSGCGKSTLLHICGGMDRPTHGDVRIEGRSLTTLDDDQLTRVRREKIGFVFQFFNLLPTLNVAQNIGLPLLLAGQTDAEVTRRAVAEAARVGLSHRIEHYPQQLSGGELQRAAIARAIIHTPSVLIADEPTGNLDSENGVRVVEMLRELNRKCGVAILLATHDDVVASVAQRVLHMRDGRLVRVATASGVESSIGKGVKS